MTKKVRPNVTGKGPALAKDIVGIFNDILSNGGSMQATLESELADRGADLQKIGKMAYLKTVKAGEVSWDLKELSLELKSAVDAGDEAKTKELLETVTKDLDFLINKIKTFVVRMT